jgi:hypothetical protein
MGLLDNLQPGQRQILMVGAPIVAVFAFNALRKPAAAPAASTDGTTSGGSASTGTLTTGWTMPSTDAIGTGQLADFESSLTGGLNDLSTQVATVTDLVANPPLPPPPLPAPPAPAPETGAPAPAVCAAPGIQMNPGEVLIGHLNAPGGGCWWFSNYGGVFASGGAPFKGSAINARFGPGYENPPRLAVSFNPLGSGYQIWSNRGEHYDFP